MGQCAMYWNYCVESPILESVRSFALRNWTIKLPKPDPNSERIEVLTDEQFQKLHEVWASYHDRHIAHLHQFIGWSGLGHQEY